MSRWKAAFIRLLISILIVGCVAAYMITFWYPPALIEMAKADRLLMLIAGIDLITGPLLTLIIFKANKPKLKFDMFVLGVIQVICLGYGLSVAWNSRPVFIVAAKDRFELVFANEITSARLSAAKEERFRHFSFARPVLVGTIMPVSMKEQEAILMSALSQQGDIQTMPRYFVDYSKVSKALLDYSKPIVGNEELSAGDIKLLNEAAISSGRSIDSLRYLGLSSSRGFAVMLVDGKTGKPVGPVNIDP